MSERVNEDVAGRLEEVARLLAEQGANRSRVHAYQRAGALALAAPVVRSSFEGVSIPKSLHRRSADSRPIPGTDARIFAGTVATATHGPLGGRRVVRGRESEQKAA